MATTCRRVAVGGGRVAIELAGQLWQSPILLQQKPESSLTAKRDLRPIDSKDPGVAAGSRKAPSDGVAGHESHFHQPLGVGVGKVQFFEHSLFARHELGEVLCFAVRLNGSLFDTHLQFPALVSSLHYLAVRNRLQLAVPSIVSVHHLGLKWSGIRWREVFPQ